MCLSSLSRGTREHAPIVNVAGPTYENYRHSQNANRANSAWRKWHAWFIPRMSTRLYGPHRWYTWEAGEGLLLKKSLSWKAFRRDARRRIFVKRDCEHASIATLHDEVNCGHVKYIRRIIDHSRTIRWLRDIWHRFATARDASGVPIVSRNLLRPMRRKDCTNFRIACACSGQNPLIYFDEYSWFATPRDTFAFHTWLYQLRKQFVSNISVE